ncbi:MAG: aminopeptidase [Gammaproteobacteria bacterium]|nr:aminopeptidase [Gammaproteobacteria bacterium]
MEDKFSFVMGRAFVENRGILKPVLLIICTSWMLACSNTGYYLDAINGHAELLKQQRSVDDVLKDPAVSPSEKEKLGNLLEARSFASSELLLPDNESYRQYADIKRSYAVWNVVAAKPLSLKPRQWCYLFVGCMSYRGFFSEIKARKFAAILQKDGWDVYVGGVKAYSTLGWFDDPLLNTMLATSEAHQVGLLFHELAHQLIYRKNDSTFNESFATTVEQEGLYRWFTKKGDRQAFENYLQASLRDEQFLKLLLKNRSELEEIYKRNIDQTEKIKQKAQQFEKLRKEYKELKIYWNGYSGYDNWINQDLNNAHLALLATYNAMVPVFKNFLSECKKDLNCFYAEVKKRALP